MAVGDTLFLQSFFTVYFWPSAEMLLALTAQNCHAILTTRYTIKDNKIIVYKGPFIGSSFVSLETYWLQCPTNLEILSICEIDIRSWVFFHSGGIDKTLNISL